MPDENTSTQSSPKPIPESQGSPMVEFNRYRALLFSIAYRMLGSAADAEDMLQETFIRWQQAVHAEIRSPRSFLVTVISRLCIQHLERARAKREEYVGTWLPEPLFTAGLNTDTAANFRMQESLSIAFLLLLEKLTPNERAVFLLHEVFDYEYVEISHILGKAEATCRQLLRRARQHIAADRPRFHASPEQHRELLQEFLAATSTGNLDKLVAMLSDQVVLYSDGGGNARAALNLLYGRERVGKFVLGAVRQTVPVGVRTSIEEVNGQPSLIFCPPGGLPGCMLTFDIVDDHIRNIYVVTNPDKLMHLAPNASENNSIAGTP